MSQDDLFEMRFFRDILQVLNNSVFVFVVERVSDVINSSKADVDPQLPAGVEPSRSRVRSLFGDDDS